VLSTPLHSIHRDLAVSHVLGPVRILLPAIALFITYPILLHRNGLAVLGVWSVLSTVVTYTSLLDIGFTSALTRAMAEGNRGVSISRVAAWRISASVIYLIGGALLCLVASVGLIVIPLHSVGVLRREILASVLLLVLAAVCQLLAKLELTVFRAHHQTYVEQWSMSVATTVTYLVGLIGAFLFHPVFFLAAGCLFANASLYTWVRWAARRRFHAFFAELRATHPRMSLAAVRDLIEHGKHFFSLSLVFVIREPVFRLLIAWELGANVVGAYDIANRVPMLIRELGASGSVALFAGLSRLEPAAHPGEVLELLQSAFFYLFAIGGTGLAGFAVWRDTLFALWLGKVAIPGLSHYALLTALWWAITLINVPFFWLLQAWHREKSLGLSVWLHTILLFVAVFLVPDLARDLTSMLTLWIVTGLGTQLIIFWVAELDSGMTSRVLLDHRVLGYAVCAALITAGSVWLGGHLSGGGLFSHWVQTCWLAAYALVCGPFLWSLRPTPLRRVATTT